jgi:hypothetical protein
VRCTGVGRRQRGRAEPVGVEPVAVDVLTIRRIVASLGQRAGVPSCSATVAGRSATHSAIATNDRAPGGHRAHRRGQHHDQAVAHPAWRARIGDLRQRRPQLGGDGERIGQFHPTHLVDEDRDGQGCRRGHGSLPMIELV